MGWACGAFFIVKDVFSGGHIQQPPEVLQAVFLPESTTTQKTQILPARQTRVYTFHYRAELQGS